MIPGTWLKWYVLTPECAPRLPIYFRFVGHLLTEEPGAVEASIVDTQWGTRLSVNEEFLHHLLPLEEGDKPDFLKKSVVKPHFNQPITRVGGGVSAPLAVAASASYPDQVNFPRLFAG